MEKIKVALASVLKPLKDPRAYYRMGLSLRETNKYLINIIGFSKKNITNEDYIKFTPLFKQKRSHWSRFFINLKFIDLLLKSPPNILIVSTYELLLSAILVKPFLNFSLVYDIQENYALNLRHNQSSKGFKKSLLLQYVKVIEYVSKPFIDHYFFAEKCYSTEFPKISNFTILENKFYGSKQSRTRISFSQKKTFSFLITGTLTKVYGVLEGIYWFKKIHLYFPNSSLKVIGYTPINSYSEEIKDAINGFSAITVRISEHPVPYTEIITAYEGVDFCLMPYYQLPSIAPKVPSKLYEALALGVPSLFSPNPNWKHLVDPCNGGAEIDFSDQNNAVHNFSIVLQKKFFTTTVSDDVLWKSDAGIFLESMERLKNKTPNFGQ